LSSSVAASRLTADCDDSAPGVSSKHECVLVGPQREDRRVGEEGRPQGREGARRFGVDRATVKRYCKLLDERGTLLRAEEGSRQGPEAGREGEKARRREGEKAPRRRSRTQAVGHPLPEGRVPPCHVRGFGESEATICRTLRRLSHSRKKDPRGHENETSS
jgi:hypothetical protein